MLIGWWLIMAVALMPTALICTAVTFPEKTLRLLTRWRYHFLGEPDADGWRAKASFERGKNCGTEEAPDQD